MIIREAWSALRRSPVVALLTSLTIGIALGILALVLYLSYVANRSLDDLKRDLVVNAFLGTSLSSREAYDGPYEAITTSMRPSIAKADFISREEAAQNYFSSTGEDVVTVLGFNPLPASIEIHPRSTRSDSVEAFAAQLARAEGVDEVRYDSELLETLERRSSALRRIALILSVILLGATLMLSAVNTRLALGVRRETIKTMRLLGAHRRQLYFPYIIEGTVGGLLGGAMAVVLWLVLLRYVMPILSVEMTTTPLSGLLWIVAALLVLLGGVVGFLGSSFSAWRVIRRYARGGN